MSARADHAAAPPPARVVQFDGRWLVVQPMRAPGLPNISWMTVQHDCLTRASAEQLAASINQDAQWTTSPSRCCSPCAASPIAP